MSDYEGYRASQAKISRARSTVGRDIGPLPPVADPDRRDRGRDDLAYFARTYFPNRFKLAFAPFHLEAFQQLEECILRGGLFLCLMPRGSGKDTITEVALLWAALYGHRSFLLLINATEKHAERS